MNTAFIILLVLAAIVGNALIFLAIRRGTAAKAAMEDLARSCGWTIEEVTDRFGSRMVIRDPDAGWRLETISSRSAQTGSGTSTTRVRTLWTDPDLSLPEGTAVYGPPLPAKTVEMLGRFMDKDGGLAGYIIKGFTKKLGTDVDGLNVVQVPDDPATLLATPGQEQAFEALKGATALLRLNQFGDNIANAPFLVRNQDGLVLRLNRRLKGPGEASSYVETAQELAAQLRRGA